MFVHKFRMPNASTVVLKVLGNVKYLSCDKWNVKKCVQVARLYYLTYILKELPYKSLVFCALMHINHCASNKTKTIENNKQKWMKKTEHIVGHLIDCGVAIAGKKKDGKSSNSNPSRRQLPYTYVQDKKNRWYFVVKNVIKKRWQMWIWDRATLPETDGLVPSSHLKDICGRIRFHLCCQQVSLLNHIGCPPL